MLAQVAGEDRGMWWHETAKKWQNCDILCNRTAHLSLQNNCKSWAGEQQQQILVFCLYQPTYLQL